MINTWLRRVRFEMYIEWPSIAMDPICTEPDDRVGGDDRSLHDATVSAFLADLSVDPQLAAAGVSVVEAYRLRGGTCGALFESLKADDTIFEFVRARMKVVRRRHVRYYRPGTITLGRSREYALV